LSDLRKIDAKVFKLSPAVDKLLSLYYSKGFGFIVCKFGVAGLQAPIAFTHPLPDRGNLFIPLRHDDGNGKDDSYTNFDHTIFSASSNNKSAAGLTVEEENDRLAAEAKANHLNKVEPPKRKVADALAKFPAQLAKVDSLRRLRLDGLSDNKDLLLSFGDRKDVGARKETRVSCCLKLSCYLFLLPSKQRVAAPRAMHSFSILSPHLQLQPRLPHQRAPSSRPLLQLRREPVQLQELQGQILLAG